MRLLALLLLASTTFAAAAPFEITDGDRVLLLGDALLERENTYGSLETRMHEQFPTVRFTVRNLSWSGETPKGWSRASFDPPAKGWARLQEQIADVKPTVVFLGFGMAASLQELTDRSGDMTLNPDPVRYGAEPMTAGRFKKELSELMGYIDTTAKDGKKVRYVLLSPIAHEYFRGGYMPVRDAHNVLLIDYSEKIQALAKERNARFAPLLPLTLPRDLPRDEPRPPAATDNGINLTERGYLAMTAHVAQALEWPNVDLWSKVEVDQPNLKPGVKERLLQFRLTKSILRKNDLFFHQFRPANSTYLFGFRKHEQGRNAAEMPKFTPLIDELDAEIHAYCSSVVSGKPVHLSGSDTLPEVDKYFSKEVTLPKAKPADNGPPPESDGFFEMKVGPRFKFGAVESDKLEDLRKPLTDFLAAHKEPRIIVRADKRVKYAEVKTALMLLGELKVAKVIFSTVDPDQPKPPPAEPVAPPPPLPNFQLADDLEITLWADTDLVGKPVGMNWDSAGRLWIACSPVYPQITPGAHPDDKVVVLEDTDHDGKADKTVTFASDLLIAAGVAPDAAVYPHADQIFIRAGARFDLPPAAYVAASTELLRLEDTNGDGRADERRIIFSGFGTEDTHHTIHSLRWGPDGRLYFNQSIYIHSHLETPWGMVRLNSGANCAYDPSTERVEVMARGFINSWGHAWDQHGQSFATDGAGGGGINWVIPGGMYTTYEGARRILPSVSPGGYPKFCGLELIQSPLFPKAWQGNAITCDFRAHKLSRFQIDDLGAPAPGPDGKSPEPKSGYITKELPNPVTTSDANFRPIDVKLGPDGALYIADWTNPIINHGEVDFRDPRRDHVHGRIWRLAPKGSKPLYWKPIAEKPNPEVFSDLLSDNQWTAEQALRILCQRRDALGVLYQRIKGKADPLMDRVHHADGDPAERELLTTIPSMEWAQAQSAERDAHRALAFLTAIDLFPRDLHYPYSAYGPGVVRFQKEIAGELNERLPKTLAKGSFRARASIQRILGVYGKQSLEHARTSEGKGYHQGYVDDVKWAMDLLARASRDPHPRVRLKAMRALARIPTKEAAALVLEAALKAPAGDPYYEYAAWHSVNDLAPYVIEWVESEK